MSKRLPLFALVVMLTLAMVSCGAPERSAPTQGRSAGGEVTQTDMAATGVRVSCIDVGKGDCLLVQAGPSAVLIDTGYEDTADEVLAYLAGQGVARLDAVVLTHYDKDHIGGLRPVAEAVPIAHVYLPGYVGADKNYTTTRATVDDLGLAAQPVTEELTLELGTARLTIYPSGVVYVPDANGDEGNDNDASLVAALTCNEGSFLFAGDLEKEGIEAYLREEPGCFDVLKMPHHGEKSSKTDELIDAIQPKIALITDSADEPADKKTLKLLKKAGVDSYRTSEDGTIVVEGDGAGGYKVETAR